VKLLDTTVAVDHLRGAPEAVRLLDRLAEEDELLAASELVRFELLVGAHDPELDALERFFSSLLWMPVTEEITREAGSLARRYRAAYGGIDDVDYLIAATAVVLEAELLTTNVRHFPMLDGLEPTY
jgi:predicted nucleic acid-binding protein